MDTSRGNFELPTATTVGRDRFPEALQLPKVIAINHGFPHDRPNLATKASRFLWQNRPSACSLPPDRGSVAWADLSE